MAGKGVISVMNRSGDSEAYRWDTDPESRANAAVFFAEQLGLGYRIADLTPGRSDSDNNFVTLFRPDEQTELLVVPKMVGG